MSKFHILKKSFLFVLIVLLLTSCSNVYRDYNDEDLELLAVIENNFSEYLFFKIVDSETAKELTGTVYTNSGIIVGRKDGLDRMLFVPKLVSKDAFILEQNFYFSISEIYSELRILEDEDGIKLFNDPSDDYGGLSISISPYENIININPQLQFDSPVFFIITTDELTLYVGYVNSEIYIFNNDYEIVN